MTHLSANGDYLTIGELSRATGISTHSLRMWERRHGAPKAHRLPSGHRRYAQNEVPRLRAIAKALESGYRASKVVSGTLEEVQEMLGLQIKPSSGGPHHDEEHGIVPTWIEATADYNEERLHQGLFEAWGKFGPLFCVTRLIVPFIQQVGKGWEDGELDISQEHFASECLSAFLSEKWRRLNKFKTGLVNVFTTMPDEPHQLGLLLCATITALTDVRIIFLGRNTPYENIVKAVAECNAEMLGISMSNCVDPQKAEDFLFHLSADLPEKTRIITGGNGVPRNIPRIRHSSRLDEYYDWLVRDLAITLGHTKRTRRKAWGLSSFFGASIQTG